MFLAGADGQTPELRAPSIKGAMRFWWRALNGHLPLEDIKDKDGNLITKGLQSREAEIFGGVGAGQGRSKVLIRLSDVSVNTRSAELVPHKPFMKQEAIIEGEEFEVSLSLTRNLPEFSINHLKSLFELVCILGGFGKRVRRGMGSVHIMSSSSGESLPGLIDLAYIHKLIHQFTPFYTLSRESIDFNYSGRSPKFGYIKQIQIGDAKKEEELLNTISNATHKVKEQNGYAYDPSMGHAFRGRYASPVYVSVIKGSIKPIITTLNIAPDKNEHQASRLIQEDFKKRIL